MANLVINLEVNDNEFKEICYSNITHLPKDKVEELLLKAIEVALISDKNNPIYDPDSSILVHPTGYGYNKKYVPTELMKQIIHEINVEQYLEPIAKEVADYIATNYKEFIQDYIINTFTRLLFSEAKEWDIKAFMLDQLNRKMDKPD